MSNSVFAITPQNDNHLLSFEQFEASNELNQNSVTKLFMDKAGMLWVGTQDGLHSYNGIQFDVFLNDSNDPKSIAGNYIIDILQSDNDLWVATHSQGLSRLDLTTGEFTNYGAKQGLHDLHLSKLSVIGDSLWIGTQTGLYTLSLKSNKITKISLSNNLNPHVTSVANVDDKYIFVGTEKSGTFAIDSNTIIRLDIPSGLRVNSIQTNKIDSSVWLAIENKLIRYDLENHTQKIIWVNEQPTIFNEIKDFVINSSDQVWAIGANSGLIQLDKIDGEWRSRVHKYDPNSRKSISENNLQSIMLAHDGTLWLGTRYSGINKLNLNQIYFNHIFEMHPSKPKMANMIRAIFRDKQQRLWIGTENAGLKSFDEQQGQFYYYNDLFAKALNLNENELSLTIHAIKQTEDGNLWFATDQGLAKLSSEQQLTFLPALDHLLPHNLTIRALTIDDKQRLWVGSSNGLYFVLPGEEILRPYHFDFETEYSPKKQTTLSLKYHNDSLWIGTMAGLVRLKPDQQTLTLKSRQPADESTLSDNRIRDFIVTSDNQFLMATHSGVDKIIELDNGNIQFEALNEQIKKHTIYAILEDNSQNLWLSSNSGLIRLNLKPELDSDPNTTVNLTTFNKFDGVQANEFNGGVKFKDPDGELWFGGINGLNQFMPENVPAVRPDVKLALTSYTFGEERHQLHDLMAPPELLMPYENKIIRFDVSALEFNYPGLHQLSYKLIGHDDRWVNLHQTNEITFTSLAPKNYELLVRFTLTDNSYQQDPLSIKFTVVPPFYLSKGAYVIYGIVIMLILTMIIYLKQIKREKQREFEISIRASEERLKLALWASGDGMWDWNIRENKVYRTDMVPPLMLGNETQALINSIHPEDKNRVSKILNKHLDGEIDFFEAEYRVEKQPGKWIWLIDRGKVVEWDQQDRPVRMAGTHKDITVRKETENELKLSTQVLHSMNEAVVVGELDYRVRSVNPAFSRITGFDPDAIAGKHFLYLAHGKRSREFYHNVELQLLRKKHWAGEINIRTKDKKGILAWLEINQVIDTKGETSHFVAVFTDITSRKKAEEDLRILANFDPLTGLPNRTLFQDRLNQAITKAHRSKSIVALLFLDLDRFKHINDSMGHHVGDLLLKAVASRLQNAVRDGDTVARLGGDEFTIILEGVAKLKAATIIAEKVLKAFNAAFLLEGKNITVSPSIGISLFPNDADDSTSLIKYADTAMYHAKSLGRNNFQFYTEELNQYATRHVELEAGLKEAIQNNELYLVYQPKYDIKTKRILGVEALLRWNSTALGFISPVEFIPLAEETGMINEIGHWAIDEACNQLASWHQLGFNDISIAVNLSARQLKADIISTIEVALAVSGLPASALELELTESMIMGNPQDSVQVLSQLKALGLTIAIDDFGTGYSSLSYLKRFPIDTLKVDREFVRDIIEDPDDAAITSAIITLAHSLDLNVVAEGVETQEQLDFLKYEGCDQVQGFLLSKPLTADDCLEKLTKDKLDKKNDIVFKQ
ncbi:EAL domain-containing protein [Shewanella olleyana]|uniref:EAL domain-containing protein n=1 Tax=Shewanella olleyana TaxID=135626 RepID=UPI00200DDD8C|nr:EAL domain-containing protein [Shewanella olleyana]MCL1067503.1 EAL domain-containing protein [Shewanella olleyana]